MDLGARVGLSQSEISKVELGRGVRLALPDWIALGIAVGRPLRVDLSRPLEPDGTLTDSAHLEPQEFVIGLGRTHGWQPAFELASRPSDPARSIDVAFRDDIGRRLLMIEIWNRIGDLGAGARSSDRKRADAQALAAAIGGDAGPYTVHLVWLLRPTAANREIVRTYPEILRARFPGSSSAWVRALVDGVQPPAQPGIAWVDPDAGRLVPIRFAAVQ